MVSIAALITCALPQGLIPRRPGLGEAFFDPQAV
jgi:hypothetical protein